MPTCTKNRASESTKTARLGRKLAALAGATGAVAAGTAEAVPYTPTAGVVAAQGIPGFSFVDSANVTLGTLRPPAQANTATDWDIDGAGGPDFGLFNYANGSARLQTFNGNNLAASNTGSGQFLLQNLAAGVSVGPTLPMDSVSLGITFEGALNDVFGFTLGQSGQFGFSFAADGGGSLFGWASIVIDGSPAGQGFKITEAYYQTTPGVGIDVGAVPQAVPEPSSIALLAIGAAGVTAWRARRKKDV